MIIMDYALPYDSFDSYLTRERHFFIAETNILIVRKNNNTLVLNFGNIEFLHEIKEKIDLPNIKIINFTFNLVNKFRIVFKKHISDSIISRIQTEIILDKSVEGYSMSILLRSSTFILYDLLGESNNYLELKTIKSEQFIEKIHDRDIIDIDEIVKFDKELMKTSTIKLKIASLFSLEKFLANPNLNQLNYGLIGTDEEYLFIKKTIEELNKLKRTKIIIEFKVGRKAFIFKAGEIMFKNIIIGLPYEHPDNLKHFLKIYSELDGNVDRFISKLQEKILAKI